MRRRAGHPGHGDSPGRPAGRLLALDRERQPANGKRSQRGADRRGALEAGGAGEGGGVRRLLVSVLISLVAFEAAPRTTAAQDLKRPEEQLAAIYALKVQLE